MLFWILVSAPFAFLIISLLLGFLTANYNHFQTTISYLVRGENANAQTANFIICGVLILVLAFVLRDATSTQLKSVHLIKIGALTLGLSLVLLGIFPTDKAGEQTLVGQIHGLIFISSVMVQATVQILFAVRNLHIGIAYTILVSGIITAVGLPSMLIFGDWRGLIQKIFVGGIMWWVTIGALLLKKI